ncbi:MAG TPA: sulfite reductase subunit alpha [Stellaceae bacterium]|nr:sulfite reductase subunit alpha [Stellaceae bacterium]
MSHIVPLLPENAPFAGAERAWINGWLGAYFGSAPQAAPAVAAAPAEEFPWHDMTLALDERMLLADGKPLQRRLMAAMAQQDCGQCGYLCQTYAEAIGNGTEKSLSRCIPGGKPTARALKEILEMAPLPAAPAVPVMASAPAEPSASARALARLEAAVRLNGEGSAKDTRHVVFDIADAGLSYAVGDSLGVHATNCPETVAAIIDLLSANPSDEVDCPDGTRRTLKDALLAACDIARPSDEAVEVLASRAPEPGESNQLQALAEGYPGAGPEEADLLDLLLEFPSARPPVQELVSALAVLQPRLYSIASSPKEEPNAVNLTVSAVRWRKRGRLRTGVASVYLADRASLGSEIPVYVQKSNGFGLPEDNDVPIIMIGPGTGVAPFRAFLQERRAIGAKGRNWLFFGDQRRASDFLYEDELTEYEKDGLLTHLDVAFSRDQSEKIYVQQRMRERASELWAWLQEGAHLFVCGAIAMAKDVDTALAAIIARQGGMGTGAAKAKLADLTRAKRYQKDVY